MNQSRRLRIHITGTVQGVGMRPFLFALARRLSLSGWVRNDSGGLSCEVQGDLNNILEFTKIMDNKRPPNSVFVTKKTHWIDPLMQCPVEFYIKASKNKKEQSINIPPDLAMCALCKEELFDPTNRRYRYPFISCTHCGPRWSIVRNAIYDRANTAMSDFPLCPSCRREYEDTSDRRFHHQANCCPACGPQLELLDVHSAKKMQSEAALVGALTALKEGKILALKGIGGFQLVVAADNQEAVARLRRRKRRPKKPLAVMVGKLSGLDEVCHVSELENALLGCPSAPIVLLDKKTSCNDIIAEAVSPNNKRLGVMLPYSPLHALLMASYPGILVVTSGNLNGEPLCTDNDDALNRLCNIADYFLMNDRSIVRPLDDSVAQIVCKRTMILRRARGLVPRSFPIEYNSPNILAMGSSLKNAIAILSDNKIQLGQHIGDLDTLQSIFQHKRQCQEFIDLYKPRTVVCDLHRDAPSSRNIESTVFSKEIKTQHHHAHIAATILEHRLTSQAVGLAWDGFGLGGNGNAWGGEFFLVDGMSFERFAHFDNFLLVGNDCAAKETYRAALGVLYRACDSDAQKAWALLTETTNNRWAEGNDNINFIIKLIESGRYCTPTSSVGRLFDAVAYLLGLERSNDFEGEAAMQVQFSAESAHCSDLDKRLPPMTLVEKNGLTVIEWRDTMLGLIERRRAGQEVNKLALFFHKALVEAAVKCVDQFFRTRLKGSAIKSVPIILGGGCFQNRLLTETLVAALHSQNYRVYWPQEIPPNDGGLAAGQAFIASAMLQNIQQSQDKSDVALCV